MKRVQVGLKLWSTNENYLKPAKKLYEADEYDYIELYVVPGSFDTYSKSWQELNIPINLHAPHEAHGLNLSRRSNEDSNKKLIAETMDYANLVDADYIVIHPGIGGEIEETIKQLNQFCDERFVVENMPYQAIDNDFVCTGASLVELIAITENANLGICLDFGHGVCAANSMKRSPLEFIHEMIVQLKPKVFHLSDGELGGHTDKHLHLGKGDYPLSEMFDLLPNEALVTIETNKDSGENLDDFRSDINELIKIQNEIPDPNYKQS